MPVKIIGEKHGDAPGDRRKRNLRVRVDAALQTSQQSIVGAPMEASKKLGPCRIESLGERKFLEAMEKRDRKSTRLNSSHQIISYAVFCLKKKQIRQHLLSLSGSAVSTTSTKRIYRQHGN